MSYAHVDAVADRTGPASATLASLPLPLAHHIFLALPVDARGRASCVCRAWRDILAEPSLWTRLDMSGVAVHWRRVESVLRGAAARARGRLHHLDLSQRHVGPDALLPVLTANAGSLRELHLNSVESAPPAMLPTVEAVVAAAPLLQVLTAEETHCMWVEAPRMLRAEPPFALLQMRGSLVLHFDDEEGIFGDGLATALADAALQPALSRLCLCFAATGEPAVMVAFAEVAVSRRLRELRLEHCTPPAAAPLARLLAEGSLTVLELDLTDVEMPLFRAAGAALVADALRANKTLTELHLCRADLCEDMRVAGTLLGALVGHPSLRKLVIMEGYTAAEHHGAFGAALAALIAADAPALHVLQCSDNSLGDAGLAPIVEALPLNRHLRELNMGWNDMSEAFARERLLPAVRANTTLCTLACGWDNLERSAADEAEKLVRRRHRRHHH